MKFIAKLLMVIVLLLIFLYAGIWSAVHFKAKDIAVEQLEQLLNKDVEIKSVDLLPLVGLRVRELEIEDFASFSDLRVKLDLLKTIKHGLGFKFFEIDDLTLYISKDSNGNLDLPFELSSETKASPVIPDVQPKEEQAKKDSSVKVEEKPKSLPEGFAAYLGQFVLNNAKIVYSDKANNKGIEIPVEELKVKYISFPLSTKSRFELNAGIKIANQLIDDSIKLKGWLDWPKRNMEAEFVVQSLPLAAVDVFLPSRYDAQNLGIDDASFELVSNLLSKNNELELTALVKIPEYHYAAQPKDAGRALIVRSVLESLKKKTGTAQYELKLKTKLDKPEIDMNQFKAMVLKDKASMTVDFGTTVVEQLTGKKTADYVEELDAKDKAAVGAAGAILDSVLGTKAEGEDGGVISGLLDAYTKVKEEPQAEELQETVQVVVEPTKHAVPLEYNQTKVEAAPQAVPVVVEEEKDFEDQLEDAAIEAGVSILKGLFE